MPNAYIKKLAKQGKGSVEELEKKWNQAKKIAEKEGHGNDYGYIVAIFKSLAHISESLKDVLERVSLERQGKAATLYEDITTAEAESR